MDQNKFEHCDVFISYRRSDGSEIAKCINDYLKSKGMKVFFDQETMIKAEDFDKQIRHYAEYCRFYLFVASKGAFDFKPNEPGGYYDYLAEEMRIANAHINDYEGRLILPVIPNGVEIPKEKCFPERTYDVMKNEAQKLNGNTPTDEELRQILDIFCSVSRSNLWHAGRRWLEDRKEAGNRFFNLNIDNSLEPQAIKVAQQKNEEEFKLPLMDAIKNTSDHIFVIGEGGIGKTTSLISLMNEAYAEEKEYNDKTQIPLFVELSKAPDSYGMVYEQGNSSFIRRAIFRQIRTYLSVKKVSKNQVSQIDNLFELPPETAVCPIDKLLTNHTSESPEYLLLLDGLNEVSRASIDEADGFTVTYMITQEINWIMQECPNVRVILTSRTDSLEVENDKLVRYNLSGIDDEQIKSYLKNLLTQNQIDAVCSNSKLFETLRNPLFLTLYAQTENTSNISTRGEILRAFFHERKHKCKEKEPSAYTAQSRLSEVFDDVRTASSKPQPNRLTDTMQSFIYDYILPEIAYQMEKEELFNIYEEQLEDIITSVLTDRSDIAICGKYGKNAFDSYGDKQDVPNIASKIQEKFRESSSSEIIDQCERVLCILQKSNGELSFIHQHIRDYFAAVRIVNFLRLALHLQKTERPDLALEALSFLRNAPINPEVRRFIGEYLHENHNKPKVNDNGVIQYNVPDENDNNYKDRALLKRSLNLFRKRFDEEDGYCVYNLIQTLVDVRTDLRGEDFSNLDLRKCSFEGAILGNDGCVAVFSGALLSESNLLPAGHTKPINDIVYSLDGKSILTTSSDGTVKVWDALTFQQIKSMQRQYFKSPCSAFSRNGNYLAVFLKDDILFKTVQIWDIGNDQLVKEKKETIYSSAIDIAYSPDGNYLAFAGDPVFDDSYIDIWDIHNDCIYRSWDKLPRYLSGITYSPDGNFLAGIFGNSNSIQIWDIKKNILHKTLDIFSDSPSSIRYSPEGNYLAATFEDHIQIWDIKNNCTFKNLNGFSNAPTAVAFSPDEDCIAIGFSNGSYEVWDIQSLTLLHCHKTQAISVKAATYRKEGLQIDCIADDNSIYFFDSILSNGFNYKMQKRLFGQNTSKSNDVFWCWHKIRLGSKDDYSVDFSFPSELKPIPFYQELVKEFDLKYNSHRIAYDSSEKYVAVCFIDEKSIKVWDTENNCPYRIWDKLPDPPSAIAFSPTNNSLAAIIGNSFIQIWDIESGCSMQILNESGNDLTNISYSPSGDYLVFDLFDYSNYESTIQIWDVKRKILSRTIATNNEHFWGLTLSPENDFLVAFEITDPTVYLFDLKNNNSAELVGHSGPITSAVFSPNGKNILSTSEDGTMRIWDIESRECTQEIRIIPGLFVIGCDFRNLHSGSHFSDKAKELLDQHGAII